MKMKKRILMAVALASSVVVLPAVAVQARRGADDPAGHVRQEDRRADMRTDSTTTVAPTTTEGVILSDTSSGSTTPTSTTTTTQTPSVLGATTLEEAVAIAKEQFPTKTVEKVEKKFEHSTNVWSVRFTDNSRVDVSVETGEVVRLKDKTNNSRSSLEDDDKDDKSGSDDSNDEKDQADSDDSDNSNDD